MEIGIIGLGKMGANIASNLVEQGYQVRGLDTSPATCEAIQRQGISTFLELAPFLAAFSGRRVIWLMLPAGEITENMVIALSESLNESDIVIEGGNSFYQDSIRRATLFAEKKLGYLDCGTSGGISGARKNACLMIGGEHHVFQSIEPLFSDLACQDGYLYAGASGSGHFLKMIHNGIEYGMMQAIGEGLQLVEKSAYDFDLTKVTKVWNHGSVIRSWLMELMETQLIADPKLATFSSTVAASGEAKWTVETALEMNLAVPVIASSLFARNLSQENDPFSAKVVSALRNGFGGHESHVSHIS